MATRWGVVGCGKISADFVTALKAVKGEHCVVAVAARSLTRAHEFSRVHSVGRSYGSYEELARDEEVGKDDVKWVAGVTFTLQYLFYILYRI